MADSRLSLRSLRFAAADLARGLPAVSPLTLGLALRYPRGLPIFLADTMRSYRNHAGLRIPAITPKELLGVTDPVSIRVGEQGVFFVTEPEMLVAQLAAMLRPKRCFEIGTFMGWVTCILAMNTPADTTIFTLDLPPNTDEVPQHVSDLHLITRARTQLGQYFRDTPWAGKKIVQLLGDSMTFDYAPYDDSVDMVIVDASHTDEFVSSDSQRAFRMVTPGGVIVWHDYESMRSEFGVTRFVSRLRKHYGCPIYRLSTRLGDTRYAVMRVDAATKRRLLDATVL